MWHSPSPFFLILGLPSKSWQNFKAEELIEIIQSWFFRLTNPAVFVGYIEDGWVKRAELEPILIESKTIIVNLTKISDAQKYHFGIITL